MEKFNRNFAISIQNFGTTDVLNISPPFTLKFSINRSFFGSPNSARFEIYNLNEDSRSFIRKDYNDWAFIKGIVFAAGYGENLSVALRGNVNIGYSERRGTDWVTIIQAFDGGAGFLNSNISSSYTKGTSQGAILRNMAKSLEQYGISVGSISPRYDTQRILRGNSYSGNALDIMSEISGGGMFVDNEVVNIMSDTEFIEGEILLVDSSTGLLGAPVREWNNVTFNMLFEPRAYIGQKVRIEIGSREFDGDYVIRGLNHTGTISDSIGESCTTSIVCSEAKYMTGILPNG
ncbi:hypothetical protein phi1422_0062 [Bdellovibrio phage phi1422]|uniref:baseplate hub n=1 Tax=Bdellovibrio phage phi1422 TaxID=1127515 RepID=UPI0002536D72|nr:baseplate hub [Bdellovibrio phage phi1422]AFC22582.1 hypothetical protein phi1422_0062 [Bdellovibrio phage phi1422]